MIRKFLLIFCILVNNCSLSTFSNISKEWNDYKIKFQKDYSAFEDIYRRTIWCMNRNLINLHNSKRSNNQNSITTTYKLSLNQFSDMTQTEFSRIFQRNLIRYDQQQLNDELLPMNRFSKFNKKGEFFKKQIIPQLINSSSISASNTARQFPVTPPTSQTPPPESIDWRDRGAVSPSVKNQGRYCSTGWAFATLEALESHNFINFGSLPSELSAQNLIDCIETFDIPDQYPSEFLSEFSKFSPWKNIKNFQNYQNYVCNQQTPNDALEYIIENQNVNTELSYPYENGKQGRCRYNPNNIGATCAAIRYLPEERDDYLLQVIGNIGPVIIGYDPTSFNFMHYGSGVYDEPIRFLSFATTKNPLNHFLLIIGYGNDPINGNYWIAKNSFGKTWGENGFIRITRKSSRPISRYAMYPIV